MRRRSESRTGTKKRKEMRMNGMWILMRLSFASSSFEHAAVSLGSSRMRGEMGETTPYFVTLRVDKAHHVDSRSVPLFHS